MSPAPQPRGYDFDVCLRGVFGPSEVLIRWCEQAQTLGNALMARVNSHWREACAGAQESALFDGPLCRLDAFACVGERLQLSLSPTNYRLLQGTSGKVWADGMPAAARADGIGVNSLLTTADRRALLVRRSTRVFDCPGMLDTGGGHLDPRLHRCRGRPDPFVAIEAEARDEFGLRPSELHDTRLLGIARHRPGGKPELLFLLRTSLPFEALPQRLKQAPEGDETAGLESVPLDQISEVLRTRREELSPAGQAALYFAAAALTDESRGSVCSGIPDPDPRAR